MDVNSEEVLRKTEEFVKKELAKESSGHDWWHIYRVWKTAVYIAQYEPVDLFVIQLAAFLHDLDDYKLRSDRKFLEPILAQGWLRNLKVKEEIIDHVCEIIKDLSFKGSGVETLMQTREGMVVQDADRLDALGAIGIARTFSYGGSKGSLIHDPNEKPKEHASFEEYRKHRGTTINHFYEKLLLLKGLMNTETAKRIAEKRHQFLELFLERFYEEWEGKD
jgi:uncharacterized protein